MSIRVLSILTILLAAWLPARTQQVSAGIALDTNTILIGDQIHMTLSLHKPETLAVRWPSLQDTVSKNIEIVSSGPLDTVERGGGMLTLQRKYLITSFDSGYFVIRPQHFIYNYQSDSIYDSVETNPLLLTVHTLPVDTTKAIKEIKGLLAEPYTIEEILLNFVLPALLLAAVIWFIVYAIRRRRAHKPLFGPAEKPLPPPHIEALDALNALKDKKLWQNNEVKEFYSQLTDIMRRYMERRFDFPAQEMVTGEITGSLKSESVEEPLLRETEDVLTRADLVKFAKFTPLGDENDASLRWAFDFVERTTQKENDENTTAGENSEEADKDKEAPAQNGKEVAL